MKRTTLRQLLALLTVLAVLATACGDDEGEGTAAEDPPAAEDEPAATEEDAAPVTDTGTPADAAAPDGGGADAGNVLFYSTQLAPIEEAEKVRNTILADFGGQVEYVGADNNAQWADRVRSEAEAGSGSVDLLGGLHGDFAALPPDSLTDLSDLMPELEDRGFNEQYLELGKLGTDQTLYVPWMQATYIVVASNEALDFLPDGADVNALTYDDYAQWAQNIAEETGQAKVGFPAGPGGLMHRFFQGYLLPSFTGGVVTTFPDSAPAWEWLQGIWADVHPQSLGFEFMQEPLLSGEVWVAWDHVARLKNALEQRPDDFVAVPAPSGPEGLGFMPVVAGLAVPTTAPNPDGAQQLIQYMTEPSTQSTTLQEVGFFPVVEGELSGDLSPGIQAEADAVAAQADAEDALPSLLPIGLGEQNGAFNQVFLDTFQQIVIDGAEIQPVLDQQSQTLQGIMEQTGAACWAPDEPSDGPCPVGG